jgi:hypothetical protein
MSQPKIDSKEDPMGAIAIPVSSATGSDLVRIASTRVGQAYFFGANVPKDNPNWKGPWDCAELISWAVFQAAGILYGCDNDDGNPATANAFTGYWVRDAKRFGKIILVKDAAATPGAAISRLAVPNGLGGHIVISDGRGGTIEAHSHRDGVIKGSLANRRWDFGVLVPGISYGDPDETVPAPPAPDPATIFRQTKDLTPNPIVKRIQQALSDAGFDPGKADGIFGNHTEAAVIAFQNANGLTPDGEVGPKTAAALGISLD